jgi:putative transposase
MKAHRLEFPVLLMCKVLEVSRSGYYEWYSRKPSGRSIDTSRQEVAILAAHQQTRETYGYKRLWKELISQGHKITPWKVRRIRERLGLKCKQVRKFKATTNSAHDLPIALNLLNQVFAPTKPNEVWVTDITYISTQEGWLYLAGVKDVFTCELVGYALGSRMTKELVISALKLAIKVKRPGAGLLHHSDRGSQYCSHEYQQLLKKHAFISSMSRKGNCYDNAPMESFWGSLKMECVYHCNYKTRQQAQEEIIEYIEIFYNRQRRHSRLGNIAPAVFAMQFWQQKIAA